jgi:hypothetical protein
MDIECEVRFAVVMYGGVSLAIYINGVAQELLNMVRATAPALTKEDAPALIGAMGVYRKLGQYLNNPAAGFITGIVQVPRKVAPIVLFGWFLFAMASFAGADFAIKSLKAHPQSFEKIWSSLHFFFMG